MKLTLRDDLPFVTVHLSYCGKDVQVSNVLVDTGSATTVFAADVVAQVGILPEVDDALSVLQGIGGAEVVFSRQVDGLRIEAHRLEPFEIEVGSMDYGFEINGILGMDFLTRTGAIIDLHNLQLAFSKFFPQQSCV